MARACRIIEEAEESLPLAALAATVGFSPFHFQRLFKGNCRRYPQGLCHGTQGRRFQESLREERSVTQAMYEAGFGSSSRCYEKAAAHLGMTPPNIGRVARGSAFAMRWCDAISAGCWWQPRNEVSAPSNSMTVPTGCENTHRALSAAELRGNDFELTEWMERVLAALDEPGRALDLPLDIRGTAFPVARVAGAASDSDRLDRQLCRNRSDDRQAFGGARRGPSLCFESGRRPHPCHRIVRGDGGLGGYRWDLRRKQALLDREAARRDTSADFQPETAS